MRLRINFESFVDFDRNKIDCNRIDCNQINLNIRRNFDVADYCKHYSD